MDGKACPLFLILLAQFILGVCGDCDRHGLCRQMVNMIHDQEDECHTMLDCVKPAGIDCMNDMALSNRFVCDAADCIGIAAVLKGGADHEVCVENFPQVVGTSRERSPSSLRGQKEGAVGSWKQKWGNRI